MKGPVVGLPTQGKDSGTKGFFVSDRRVRNARKTTETIVTTGRAARTSPRYVSTPCISIARSFERLKRVKVLIYY